MKDGKSMTLTTNSFKNTLLQATYENWCQSEIVQAVGRGRPIHGKPMDVYVFSDESLGSDVEVFDFFDFDHSDRTTMLRIGEEVEFVEDVRREMIAHGYTEHEYKKKYDQIFRDMTASNFRRVRVEYCDTHRYELRNRTYFSRNDEALVRALGGRDHIITPIDEGGNPVTL